MAFASEVGCSWISLRHVVVVGALAGLLGVPLDRLDVTRDRPAIGVRHRDARRRQDHDVAVLEVDDLIGVLEEGRDVAGEEVLLVADAQYEQGPFPGRVHGIFTLEQRGDSVTPLEVVDRPSERGLRVGDLVAVVVDQMGTTSVSVSLVNRWPASTSRSRSPGGSR